MRHETTIKRLSVSGIGYKDSPGFLAFISCYNRSIGVRSSSFCHFVATTLASYNPPAHPHSRAAFLMFQLTAPRARARASPLLSVALSLLLIFFFFQRHPLSLLSVLTSVVHILSYAPVVPVRVCCSRTSSAAHVPVARRHYCCNI